MAEDIILDPGFGFGKTLEHNYELMAHLEEFSIFELPVLVGVSRKSMIYKLLGGTPQVKEPLRAHCSHVCRKTNAQPCSNF